MEDWEYSKFRDSATDKNGRTIDGQTDLSEEQFVAVARDEDSRTLLHHLCRGHEQRDVAAELRRVIAIGANVNARDCDGRTALHELCGSIYGHAQFDELEAIDVLLRAGAEIDARDNRGDTPLMYSLRYMCPETDESEEDEEGMYIPPISRHLLMRGAQVNISDQDGLSPLHLAVAYDYVPLARLLLDHGADATVATIGNEHLYNRKLVLLDNHSGVPVPVGSTPLDIAQSDRMRELLAHRAVR